ncbi:threonine synthase [Oscillospiraceae bacterium OttesenSCG-928-F05]|nr:threonine synthase [Oscillospiraceae bacterium OttesenSCG-928-F05]
MKYISTRGGAPVTAEQAILTGLAPDGGLYVPEKMPRSMANGDVAILAWLAYARRAAHIMAMFLDDFPIELLTDHAEAAYGEARFGPNPAPVVKAGEDNYFLELWHGPTCAFKDMALQILPRLLSESLKKSGQKEDALILVATSGDTGKAALEGFCDIDRTKIMAFYPRDGVSRIQQLQMTTQEGANVAVQAVNGNFDDTQTGVKAIFSDPAMQRAAAEAGYQFSSANSINWGRVLPQIVYYISAYCDMVIKRHIKFGETLNVCVPTGNFGNILAAHYVKSLGVPIGKLICASNQNDVLTEFIRTGVYNRNRPFHLTLSPSMDILISSNLERLLFDLSGRDSELVCHLMDQLKQTGSYTVPEAMREKMADIFWADASDDTRTKATIQRVFQNDGYLLDPHTAVAQDVVEKYRAATGDETKTLTVSTASPYKFCGAVLGALGEKVGSDGPELIDALFAKTGAPVPAQLKALEKKTERFTGFVEKDGMAEAVRRFMV